MPNKRFSFKDYHVIGFDLDCAVIRWKISEITPLVIETLRRFLVERRSYPSFILDLEINIDFIQKGLILDADRGNILKLGVDGSILRAAHGTSSLSQQEIIRIYGQDRKWDLAMLFVNDPLSVWNDPWTRKFRLLKDYFDFMVGWLFAQLIDIVDLQAVTKKEPKPQIYEVFTDILDALTDIYSNQSFYDRRNLYFTKIRADPKRYLHKTSTTVINWLKDLRKSNKFLVLITGSQLEFADFAAQYALGKDYQSLFDVVVFRSKESAFFAEPKPFLRVEEMHEVPFSQMCLNCDLELNHSYTNGNWPQLLRSFAHISGKSPTDIRSLYVGDNYLLNAYMPKKHCRPDSAAICEELIAEKHSAEYDFRNRKYLASNFWGSYFFTDSCPTFWMRVISENSKICTPFLEYLAEVPVTHIFVTKKPGGFYL